MQACIRKITTKPDFLLIDFEKIKELNIPSLSIVKGDTKSISIAAASILAKVARDEYMIGISKQYSEYDLATNKGYLTKKHLNALKEFGPHKDIHRYTYKPIRSIIK